MKQYIELLQNVLEHGIDRKDRTGVGSKSVFGRQLRFELSAGFPLVTTRPTSLRIAFEETMFFLRGQTDTKILEEKNIGIWKGNTSREFLDNIGLNDLPEGSTGKSYGHQWRNFDGDLNEHGVKGIGGVDQITNLLNSLKNDPDSRRHVVTAWNPSQLKEMALPPCHLMHMYSIAEGKLHNSFIMRSSDGYHGLGFNIAGYALLNHIFAKYLGLLPGDVVYMGWDCHLYNTQLDVAREQIKREPKQLPQLKINKDLNTIDDIMNLEFSDIELIGYDPHPALIKVSMAI